MKKENWNNLAMAIKVRCALLFHRYRDTIECTRQCTAFCAYVNSSSRLDRRHHRHRCAPHKPLSGRRLISFFVAISRLSPSSRSVGDCAGRRSYFMNLHDHIIIVFTMMFRRRSKKKEKTLMAVGWSSVPTRYRSRITVPANRSFSSCSSCH